MLKVGCSVHLLSVADRKCCRRPAVCGHLHSDPAMRACCCYTPCRHCVHGGGGAQAAAE